MYCWSFQLKPAVQQVSAVLRRHYRQQLSVIYLLSTEFAEAMRAVEFFITAIH